MILREPKPCYDSIAYAGQSIVSSPEYSVTERTINKIC